MSLCHDNLEGMIKANFNLMYHHKIPLDILENMMPWERQVYLTLVIQDMERAKRMREEMDIMRKGKRGIK